MRSRSGVLVPRRQGVSFVAGLRCGPAVRAAAASGLGSAGRRAREAVPALVEAMGDLDPKVARQAAWALGRWARRRWKAWCPHLRRPRDASGRRWRGWNGPAVARAVLEKALRGPRPEVRAGAATWIGHGPCCWGARGSGGGRVVVVAPLGTMGRQAVEPLMAVFRAGVGAGRPHGMRHATAAGVPCFEARRATRS